MNNINDKYKLLNSGIEKEKKLRRKILEKMVSDKNANIGIYQDVYNGVFAKNETLVNDLADSLTLNSEFVDYDLDQNDTYFLREMVKDVYAREFGGLSVRELAVNNAVHSVKCENDMILLEMAVKYLKENNVSESDKNKLLDSLTEFFTNSDSVRCYLAGDDIGAIMHTTMSVPAFVDNKKISLLYTDMMIEDGEKDPSLFGTLLIASAIEERRRNGIDTKEFLESKDEKMKNAGNIAIEYASSLQKEKSKSLVKVN